VEAADAELGVQLRDAAGAAAGHEEAFAFVVVEPGLDLLGALDGVALRVAEGREFVGAVEAAMRAEGLAQRFLDLGAQLRGMFGEAADLLEHREALRPEMALLQDVGEEAEEGVGLRALLGLAQRLGDVDERVDVARVALDPVHPERLDVIELFLLDQSLRIFAKTHRNCGFYATSG